MVALQVGNVCSAFASSVERRFTRMLEVYLVGCSSTLLSRGPGVHSLFVNWLYHVYICVCLVLAFVFEVGCCLGSDIPGSTYIRGNYRVDSGFREGYYGVFESTAQACCNLHV